MFSHTIDAQPDGWLRLEIRLDTKLLITCRLADRAHAERMAAHYLKALRTGKSARKVEFTRNYR